MLLLSFLVLLSAGMAHGTVKDPAPKACFAAESEAARFDLDGSVDAYEEGNYESAVARLLKESRFKELECLANSLRTSKTRFSSGDWKLASVYEAVSQPLQHPTQKDWDFTLSQLKRWGAQYPSSVTAQIALANAYVNYGWYARGDGNSDSVSENGWQLFGKRAEQARKILDAASHLSTKCPEWYNAMQQVALAQGWSVQDAHELFEKAIAFEPTYYAYYRSFAYFLEPKWYGEDGDTEKFAKEISDRIGGDDGDIVYAQIMTQILCLCGDSEAPDKLSWPRTQKGFALMETRYGVSLYNLNRLAMMAWKVSDAEIGQKVLDRVGDNWNSDVWKTEKNFKLGKQWATELGPTAAHDRVIREEAESNAQTPGGTEYKNNVEKKFLALVQDCIQNATPPLGKFVVTLRVSKSGGFESLMTDNAGQASSCMFQKVSKVYNAGENIFPTPPKPSYLVRMEIDPKAALPVAAR